MQEIAMRRMHLDNLETRVRRPLGCGDPVLQWLLHVIAFETSRHQPPLVQWQRARCHDLPWLLTPGEVPFIQWPVTMPGALHARFAASVGELDCRDRAY